MMNTIRLSGDWQVYPIAPGVDGSPEASPTSPPVMVPDSAHLQPILFPDRPYWGDHLRAVNDQAWIYRRAFVAPESAYQRARLRFDGVDYYASVWLNGQFVGHHEGHFAPFSLNVTHALRPGAENILTVRVSAPWDPPNPHGHYPMDHVLRGMVKGLYEHAEGVIPPNVNPLGIWRPVWLLLDDGVSLDDIRIRPQLDGRVDVQITATNATQQPWQGRLEVEMAAENHHGPGATARIPLNLPGGISHLDYQFAVPDPRLWWPWDHGNPDLYRLNLSLCAEQDQTFGNLTEIFGLRTVRLERTPERFTYWINERDVFVRGSSYMPGLYLSECDAAMLAGDVALARKANLNLLRVHVHVSPPELYDLCDRAGMLIWQDFELNWMHSPTAEFEMRARKMQREMISLLGNHPSIITWACHNEPTMVFARRENLEQSPDPALYEDAQRQDPTRPVFLCSGQMEDDWQRSGDVHSYYGAIWTPRYTDVGEQRFRLNTEFGFEAPAAHDTLQAFPDVWERLKHLDDQIEPLWAYQADLIRFHVECFRRLRAQSCGGYIHFWLVDLVPQVGCGVLDAHRLPKGGYEALRLASQPLHVALEHDGSRPGAVWVFNDTSENYPEVVVVWRVYDRRGLILLEDRTPFMVQANASQRVADANWPLVPSECALIELELRGADGVILSGNTYERPFQPMSRPRGYPWKFDPYLGVKVFDHPTAPSLADQNVSRLVKLSPLIVREKTTEWVLRQRLPSRVVSAIARLVDPLF